MARQRSAMSIYTEKSVSKYIAISRSNDLSNLPDPVQLNIKYALFRAVLSRHSAKDVAVGIAQIGTEFAKVRGIYFRILLLGSFSFRFRSWFSFTDVKVFAQYREHSSLLQRKNVHAYKVNMYKLNGSDSTINYT